MVQCCGISPNGSILLAMKPIVFGFIGAASVILVALLAVVIFQIVLLLRREKKEPILPLVQPKGKESASFSLKNFQIQG